MRNKGNCVSTLLVLISFLLVAGCANDNGQATQTTSIIKNIDLSQGQAVTLHTGDGSKEITWNIRSMQRRKNFLDSSLQLVQGDAIYIEGDGTVSSREAFVTGDFPYFQLEDTSGNIFNRGTQTLEGEKLNFTYNVFFQLSPDGSINESVNTGEDLIVADPNPTLRETPGHLVGLTPIGDISP